MDIEYIWYTYELFFSIFLRLIEKIEKINLRKIVNYTYKINILYKNKYI